MEDPVDVLTANHGVLHTTGHGTCIAWFTINHRCLRIRLTNCLHAPNALLRHISTGRLFARDPHQPLSASQHHSIHLPQLMGVASLVEEEEREKEKERARQKAAALEEKCKANEEKKNAQEAEAQALQLDATTQLPMPVKLIGRPPSLRASSVRLPMISRPIVPSNAEQSHDSSKTDSWRSKALPPSSPPAPRETSVQPHAPAPLLQGVEEFITVSADEDLEVVDFSDMDKLVGTPAAPQTEVPHKDNERPPRPPRPVASDFFEDSEPQSLPPRPKSPGVWHCKTPIELVREVLAPSSLTNQEVAKETGDKLLQDAPVSLPSPESIREAVPRISPSSSIADGSTTYSSNYTTLPTSPQHLICMPWREAPMSALYDVMSRIRGALDGMNGSVDESVDRNLITPGSASYSTPWTKSPLSFSSAKESPPSDKALVHTAINSLEGVADDLTALPFTLQDVKSEDGETPPPTSAANIPFKMSLRDVTRAFQQVPTSSNATTRSSSMLPTSSAAGPISRPSNYTYGPVQLPNMSVWPPFPYSPMMAHPPSPTPLVYPPPSPALRVVTDNALFFVVTRGLLTSGSSFWFYLSLPSFLRFFFDPAIRHGVVYYGTPQSQYAFLDFLS
ncbi:hypothetical protein F4604DRAFT_1998028 [Suillus subluteus]|nr:hypothetical protein F4604DRAFT_1998028 [Suillus subluteus]